MDSVRFSRNMTITSVNRNKKLIKGHFYEILEQIKIG